MFCHWNVLSKCPAIISPRTESNCLATALPWRKYAGEMVVRAYCSLTRDFLGISLRNAPLKTHYTNRIVGLYKINHRIKKKVVGKFFNDLHAAFSLFT